MDDSSTTNHTRSKRKSKVHVEVVPPPKPPPPPEDPPPDDNDDEEGGITRCVCGRTELDADEEDLGLMVMCETCKVWQHGVCVNLPEDVSADDYYCEQCRPDLHVELLKSLKKRSRHSSQHPRRHSASVPRSSRSHSPGHVFSTNPSNAPSSKPAKRRNTMNSRDAEYEDAVKQLIESTRPDSEKPTHDASSITYEKDDVTKYDEPGVIIEIVSGARKKRKRALDPDKSAPSINNGTNTDSKPDPPIKNKRTRSNSTTPERLLTNPPNTTTTTNPPTTNGPGNNSRQTSSTTSSNIKTNVAGSGKSRRGKKEQNIVDVDGSKRHPNQYTYRKPAAPTPPRRQGVNGVLNGHGPSSSEQGGSGWGVPGVSASGGSGGGGGSSSRRGGNQSLHHAPLTPQQPLLTSWGLPDYLAHLASELPTDVPRPVHVRVLDPTLEPNRAADTGMGSSSNNSGGTIAAKSGGMTDPTNTPTTTTPLLPPPVDDTLVFERGVKVKWPAKRTSVSDMNKRVRGIIDWLGREQAAALERRRRREALRRALVLQQHQVSSSTDYGAIVDGEVNPNASPDGLGVTVSKLGDISSPPESEATYLMEELMKELIAFQEKFGPGAGVSSSILGIGLGVAVSGGAGGATTISKMREGKVRG